MHNRPYVNAERDERLLVERASVRRLERRDRVALRELAALHDLEAEAREVHEIARPVRAVPLATVDAELDLHLVARLDAVEEGGLVLLEREGDGRIERGIRGGVE